LYPNRGVYPRIEIRRPSEKLGRDLILLQTRARMIDAMFSQIAKQFAKRLRAMEHFAGNYPIYLLKLFLTVGSRNPRNQHCNESNKDRNLLQGLILSLVTVSNPQ
jgi:hypothetical protein